MKVKVRVSKGISGKEVGKGQKTSANRPSWMHEDPFTTFFDGEDPLVDAEINNWAAFYYIFNDSNLSHLCNSAHNNGLYEASAAEIHQQNVEWAKKLLQRHGDKVYKWLEEQDCPGYKDRKRLYPYFVEAEEELRQKN